LTMLNQQRQMLVTLLAFRGFRVRYKKMSRQHFVSIHEALVRLILQEH
jgi:hypothetical protein